MTVNRSMRSRPVSRSRSIARMRGFTLLELLVAIAILAVVASVGAVAVGPILDTMRPPIAQYGMREVATAILRFRRDTGFWPRTGPYELTGVEGSVIPASDGTPCPPGGLNSPANLCQLFYFSSDLDPSLRWSPDTKRGWNGPYLGGITSPWVKVSDVYPSDKTGAGDKSTSHTATALAGVADGFESQPRDIDFMQWVDRRTATTVAGRGNPLLFFPPGAADSSTSPTGLTQLKNAGCNTITTTDSSGNSIESNTACLISLGPDGIYYGPYFAFPDPKVKNDDEVFNF